MRKIRIGNDIRLRLHSEDATLEGRNLRVYLSTLLGRWEVTDFTVEGATLAFTFPGKEQRLLGTYVITVFENKDEDGMRAVDICDAFKLVARSCQAGGDDTSPDRLETVTVDFDFNLTLAGKVSYGDISDKPKIGGVEIEGDKPLGEYGIISTTKILSKDIATIIEELDEPKDEEETDNE